MKKYMLAPMLVVVLGLIMFPMEGKAQMGPGMMGGGYGMSGLGQIIMLAFWIAVIVGIVFLIRWLILSTRTEGHKAHPKDSALEILRKRYAKGEIDKDEFEEKKKDLI